QVQNFDAPNPGSLAPWYARFGHSLNVVAGVAADGVTATELMVLTGGYSPLPANDVWVTDDGVDWRFVGYGDWSARAWHASAVLDGRLYVMGGAPFTNDVWASNGFTAEGGTSGSTAGTGSSSSSGTGSGATAGGWQTSWERISDGSDAPWSPRAGLAATVLPRRPMTDGDGNVVNRTHLVIAGGYGGWASGDSRYNGHRARNDVYRSTDGAVWETVTAAAPWGARAWHSLVVWHNLSDHSSDGGSSSSDDDSGGNGGPRLWLAGGGYAGTSGNRVVSTVEGYVDVWWSYDGFAWTQANYQEGSGDNLYSSMEWAAPQGESSDPYLGKWGHKLVPWQRVGTTTTTTETYVPALYLIGGDKVGTGSLVHDVFVSNDTLLCSVGGIVCGDAGTCASGGFCECDDGVSGDFCTLGGDDATSAAGGRRGYGGSDRRSVVMAGAVVGAAVSILLSVAWGL
ncbi:unnamed protein product, partial [Phaeothamnion confervicola]